MDLLFFLWKFQLSNDILLLRKDGLSCCLGVSTIICNEDDEHVPRSPAEECLMQVEEADFSFIGEEDTDEVDFLSEVVCEIRRMSSG